MLILAMGISACSKESITTDTTRYTEDDVQREVAEDVEVLYSDSSRVRVRITAPKLIMYTVIDDPRQEFAEGIKIEFLDNAGLSQGYMTAKYALRYENKGETILKDSIVWQSNKNEKLETEELIWSEREELLHTNKFVTLSRPDEVILGYGFKAKQDFSHAEVSHRVVGKINITDLKKTLE
ncbi:MAG: LPS export ABC transporter periplasmic protein LptC [Saprospiraceae bacterium]|nr:LPS export ABC transporter periplasmic protein LptC [Saprospiraceae bacterium]